MNIQLSHAAWGFVALLTFAACKNKDTEETKPVVTPTAAPTPSEAPTTEIKPDEPEGPEIPARIKAEVDGKEATAGHTTVLAAAGAKASYSAPKGWVKSAASGFSIAKSADGKASFAIGKLGEGDNTSDEAGRAVGALGLTDCKWAPAEPATLSKAKLAATVADGVCKQGAAVVRVAYAAMTGDAASLAVGSWADGSDANGVFNTFRTAKKSAGKGDATGIAACCAAIRQNSMSAPLQQKGAYLAAAGACQAALSNPQGRAALAQVRAMLRGINVPASCR